MSLKDTLFSVKHTINCGGNLIDLSRPRIMGILNITPDSFYDGGRTTTDSAIINQVSAMIQEGADILDVGGHSSRPGAAEVSPEEELNRLKKGLKLIRTEFPNLLVSVDTFRSEIAAFCVNEFGVHIINDISAGKLDDNMLSVVARLKVPYIMMHMQGTPGNMQLNPRYNDVTRDLVGFFSDRIAKAMDTGIHDILIDPGFGFGKTVAHNFTLLREMKMFEILDHPIVVGISRKSMVYKPLGLSPEDALSGTVALQVLALLNGACILRVHDVREAVQTVKLMELYFHSMGN